MKTYIHGTTSEILDILPYTEFKIMSAIDTIKEYGVVTYSGEIFGGGYTNAKHNCHPCFGLLDCKDTNCHYGLSKILDYTKRQNTTFNLNEEICRGKRIGYSNINTILITAWRCYQIGKDVSLLINDDLFKDIDLTINTFATLLYFDRYLKPKRNYENDDNSDYVDAVYTHLTFDNIKQILKEYPTNLGDLLTLVDNPTNDLLNHLINIFSLPTKSIIKSGMCCVDKEIELSDNIVFSYDEQYTNTSNYSYYNAGYLTYRLTQNCNSYSMNDLLEKYAKMNMQSNTWIKFHELLKINLIELRARTNLLRKLIHNYNVSENQTGLLIKQQDKPFPIILISNNDSDMEIVGNEYRANKIIMIGEHITKIATNTISNKTYLIDYFAKYNIHCDIILIDDLK